MTDVQNQTKQIYIVLSQTPSIVARLIRLFTRKKYSHASLSLTEDLDWMYSFGRCHPYNPFWGGFVRESPNISTFKRFRNSQIAVLAVEVTPEQLEGVRQAIENMLLEQKKYHYNYIGLFKAGINKAHDHGKYRYYCSEFVSKILIEQNIANRELFPEIIHPMNFLDLPHDVIYKGKLCEYTAAKALN